VSTPDSKTPAPQDCSDVAGRVAPIVDRNRCEAKGECVQLCPYEVFEIRPLSAAERARLSLLGRLKAWAHGNEQAFVVRAQDCHACRRCIDACPEQALRLAPLATARDRL
jgi:4Fe-4S ferredoxin